MKKILRFLSEHAMIFVISAIAFVSLILVIIVFTLASSGNSQRKITVEDISGSAFILKNDGQVPANKRMNLESGDVIITSADSSVKLSVDKDKYIYIEPDTTLYVYYTDSSEKGSIVVNISEGAAICRIDSKLPQNSVFEVRTPNAVVSAAGTVFRTAFDYYDSYGGYSEVKITEVQCSEGESDIQLYDNNASPVEKLMLLAEGKSARLMTCAEIARYEYLNNDTDIDSLPFDALKNYIRIAAERKISYSLSELNSAYQNALSSDGAVQTEPSSVVIEAETVTTEITSQISSDTVTETVPSDTVTVTVSSETENEAEVKSETSVSTAISVTSPTTRIYEVTTSPPTEEITASVTTPPQASETVSETIPPIKPAETVTSASEQVQTTVPPETSETSQSKPQTASPTIPWWEIINSSAFTSGSSRN